jgi:hypothetical protein
MESWRMVWREGLAPVLSTSGIESLWQALRNNDPRLTQGSTTTPPPLLSLADCPCDGADAIGWCGWQGERLEPLARSRSSSPAPVLKSIGRLGEPAAYRWFLNWLTTCRAQRWLRCWKKSPHAGTGFGISRLPQPIRQRSQSVKIVAA